MLYGSVGTLIRQTLSLADPSRPPRPGVHCDLLFISNISLHLKSRLNAYLKLLSSSSSFLVERETPTSQVGDDDGWWGVFPVNFSDHILTGCTCVYQLFSFAVFKDVWVWKNGWKSVRPSPIEHVDERSSNIWSICQLAPLCWVKSGG